MQRPFRSTELEELSRDLREARAAVAVRQEVSRTLAAVRKGPPRLGAGHDVLPEGRLAEIARALEDAPTRLEAARAAKRAWVEAHDEEGARAITVIAGDHAAATVAEQKIVLALEAASDALAILSGAFGENRGFSRVHDGLVQFYRRCAEAGVKMVLPGEGGNIPLRNRWVDALFDLLSPSIRSDNRITEGEDIAHDYRRAIDSALAELQNRRRALARRRAGLAARLDCLLDG